MRVWAAELVERARSEGVELTGEAGLLTALVRQVLQTGLEVEMTDHVGYEVEMTDHVGYRRWSVMVLLVDLPPDGATRGRRARGRARPGGQQGCPAGAAARASKRHQAGGVAGAISREHVPHVGQRQPVVAAVGVGLVAGAGRAGVGVDQPLGLA
jgi:hypothetical protein